MWCFCPEVKDTDCFLLLLSYSHAFAAIASRVLVIKTTVHNYPSSSDLRACVIWSMAMTDDGQLQQLSSQQWFVPSPALSSCPVVERTQDAVVRSAHLENVPNVFIVSPDYTTAVLDCNPSWRNKKSINQSNNGMESKKKS